MIQQLKIKNCAKISMVIYLGFLFFFIAAPVVLCAENGGEQGSPLKKGPSLDATGEILEFGVLEPARSSYTIENIEIDHDSARSVQVRVGITGLRHDATNAALDPEKWLRVTPVEGSSSKENPFLFNLAVKFPENMPGAIQDGLYLGRLIIESEDAEQPQYIPFRFTLNLPDLTLVPDDLADTGLTVIYSCCIPGSRGVSFGLLSDAMSDLAVKVVSPANIVNEETEESVPQSQLNVVMVSNGELISEEVIKAGKKATQIPVSISVENPSLSAGQYGGQIAIRGDYGRALYIPLHIEIPEDGSFWVDKYQQHFGVGAVIIFIILVIRPVRCFFSRRKRFLRNVVEVRSSGNTGKIPVTWNKYFSASYTGNAETDKWVLSPKGRGVRILMRGQNSIDSSRNASVEVTGPCMLSIQCPQNNNFELSVSSVTKFSLKMRVIRSPFRFGILFSEGLLYIILLVLCVGSFLRPQLWCTIFPFLS